MLTTKLTIRRYTLLIFIPLILSAFTHIWNPIGFPHIDHDEGHYMRRTMQVLEGLGPQESNSTYFYPYDHPYFGQLFLASLLKIVGYPDSLSPKVGDVHSIEMLYLVPRVLMGLLSVVDTFLIYKIAERRYSKNVAFIAAILFAVMPLSWILRRVLLESIQLPFMLSSILFSLYASNLLNNSNNFNNNTGRTYNKNLNIFLVILSGIFLGLTIFTKIPAFILIPLLVYIIYNNSIQYASNNKIKKIKILALWFVPVILIPMIWPVYTTWTGHFDEWIDGVLWQADRTSRSLSNALEHIFNMDPILLILSIAGLVYTRIKRDYFLALWIFPYLILLFFVDWVYFFHFIPMLPAFCIVAGVLLMDLLKKDTKIKLYRPVIFSVVIGILVFGLLYTTVLLRADLNSTYFELVSFVNQIIPDSNKNKEDTALIGPNGAWGFVWLIKYVFDKDVDFKWFEVQKDYINGPIENEKFILLADREVRHAVYEVNSDRPHINEIKRLYDVSIPLKVFYNDTIMRYNLDNYPYRNILDDFYKLGDVIKMRGIDWTREIEVRGNYSITSP